MRYSAKKRIPGFPGYVVYSDGRIYSKKRNKFMKQVPDTRGYYTTSLRSKEGKTITKAWHRWIALAYLGEPPKGYEVNHIDGDKLNNSIYNLEYVSSSENTAHWHTFLKDKKKHTGRRKLTLEQAEKVRQEYKEGWRVSYLALKYEVSRRVIQNIINNKTYLKSSV